jgi:osmotically-inducible protein OsmY
MRVWKAGLAVVAIFALAVPAYAQSSFGGTSTSGMFGSRNLGGGTQFGRGSSGGGSAGVGAANNSAAGAALTGSERFLEQNRRGAFVGADSGDTFNARSTGQNTLNTTRGLQGMFGNQGFFNQANRMQQFQQNFNQFQNSKQLRVRLSMGGTTPGVRTAPSSRVTTGFQGRLQRLPALQVVSPIEVVADGPVLVLRGEVASEGDRQMIEDLALLEPEVRQVRNELVVREAAPRVEALPAPRSESRSSGR